jgi:hypothetical protein
MCLSAKKPRTHLGPPLATACGPETDDVTPPRRCEEEATAALTALPLRRRCSTASVVPLLWYGGPWASGQSTMQFATREQPPPASRRARAKTCSSRFWPARRDQPAAPIADCTGFPRRRASAKRQKYWHNRDRGVDKLISRPWDGTPYARELIRGPRVASRPGERLTQVGKHGQAAPLRERWRQGRQDRARLGVGFPRSGSREPG